MEVKTKNRWQKKRKQKVGVAKGQQTDSKRMAKGKQKDKCTMIYLFDIRLLSVCYPFENLGKKDLRILRYLNQLICDLYFVQ